MIGDFIRFLSDNQLVDSDSRTLLAVSGGIDSVVMADLFHKARFSFGIAHANFHLRGEESDRDEQFVRSLADHYKVRIYVRHFETAKYAKKHKVSIQVAARQLRYEWFEELMVKHGYDHVATAHHLDDQVETFLINLARGTGIAGLHGIPVRQGKIIRPMLLATRKEIEEYAAANGLEFVEDSSNKSDKYTRNRIRHHVIPQLEKVNPSFRKALNETIRYIRDAESIYRCVIEETRNSIAEVKGEAILIPVNKFFSLDPLSAWAYELLSPYGFNLANVSDIISLENSIPGKEVMSNTHRLVRDRDHLIIIPKHDISPKKAFEISAGDIIKGIKSPVHLSFEVMEKIPEKLKQPPDVALLDLEKLEFPLLVRKWRRGDCFYPFGMFNPKKLSDFFIDQKFSKIDKENQWLLCSGKEIVWVIGHRISDRYKLTGETNIILKIRVNPCAIN